LRFGGRSFRGSRRARSPLRRACHPWRWLMFEVARLPAPPCAPVRRWPFGHSRLAIRRHQRWLHGLGCQGARRDPLESRSRRLPILASPPAFSPGRAGSVHLAVRGSFLSWNFVPCCGPISRCPRERPLPRGPEGPLFGRRLLPRRSRSALVVSHHLGGFLRSRLPACCSRYQVWVRQVSSGSVVEAEASRAGSDVPAGAPPCEGFFLVGSRTASLRPAPLLPFVASSTSRSLRLRSAPSEDEGNPSGSDPFLPGASFPTFLSGSRSRLPSASRRWVCGSGAPSVRPRAGCPSLFRGVRLDRVDIAGRPAVALPSVLTSR